MRIAVASLPLLAAAVAAFVLPDAKVFAELSLKTHDEGSGDDGAANWWDSFPSKESVLSTVEDTVDYISNSIQDAVTTGKEGIDRLEHLFDEELDLNDGADDFKDDSEDDWDDDHPKHPHHPQHPKHPKHGHGPGPGAGHGPHKTSNLTIYQLIQASNHTKKFAKLVDEFDSVVELLNSTEANYTLFLPTDAAFERLPHHGGDHKKPPKEFIEAALKYHIGLGKYHALRILHTHTLPTALNESWLGDYPQRLRTRAGLGGVKVNFYSKVIAANIPAKNGFIHAVNAPLFPPPPVGKIISLFPQRFSTLLLAFEKTDFVDYIHAVPMAGSTVFAPTNQAFARLGPKANAFLFNTEIGKKYLKAILKYHIVANETLYSDAFYQSTGKAGSDGKNEDANKFAGVEHYHVDLPTLLEKNVAVDITKWGGWISLKVNGYVPVAVQDGIAKNGVIQVVGRVLIPPHKHGKENQDAEVDGEIDVDELKGRLSGYVEGEEEEEETERGDL